MMTFIGVVLVVVAMIALLGFPQFYWLSTSTALFMLFAGLAFILLDPLVSPTLRFGK
jgi:hypothetical protein